MESLMKRTVLVISILLFGLFSTGQARDFIVQFEEENYKETRAFYSYSPVVYHSIQVSSNAGSKLLVLTGDDYHYRKWLRQYIARGMAFIVKVPPDQVDQFVKSSVFDIDVTQLHPLDLDLYKKSEEQNSRKNDTFSKPQMNPDSLELRLKKIKQMADDRYEKKPAETKGPIPEIENAANLRQADQLRINQERERRKADLEKRQQTEIEQQRLQNAKLLEAIEEQRRREEQRALEQAELFKALAEQRAEDERQRRLGIERRYEELRERLLQDERIRSLEVEDRNREIERRWFELQQRLSL